jgi:hypothetical protein
MSTLNNVKPPSASPDAVERGQVKAVRMLFGAAAALAISTLLPWASLGGLFSANLSAGGVLYLLLFAAAYGAAGYQLSQRRDDRRILTALWVVNSWMVINVILLFASFGGQADQTIGVRPAVGVFVASAGVIVAVIGTLQLRRARSASR